MSTQRFCLRWNNHQSNLLSVFDQLLHDESFVDVTLAVDGRYLKAHKIVLSACSPYFQALFVGHPDRHPIVILKDIPYVDMRSLLDFMYRGEVSVDQDRLTLFLKVAESLRIKGLTEVNEDQCDLPKIASSLLSNPLSAGSMSLSYQQRLKRPLSSSQHSLNSSSSSNLQSNNPLLGSALTGPKRKRGLPRKLSGSLAANLDLIPNKPQLDDDDDDRRLGIDPSQFLGRDEDELDEDEEFDEEDEQRSGGMSDSDMIERADSPFDNKMLEVNMSEGGGGKEVKQSQQHRTPSTEDHQPPPSEDKDDRGPSSPALSKGGREEDNPSPGPTGDVKPSDAAQSLAANVKQESRETSETTSGGDQNETNPSPTPPERFPPDHKLNRFRLQPRRDPPALLPHLSLPIKRRRRRRKTLSKSITYELNSDVSLTRGIIYEDEEGENVPNEARRRFPNPTTPSKSWKMRQRASASLLPRVKTEAQENDDRTADVVECEDVLRSLIKTSAPPSSGDGYCEETGVFGSGVHFLTTENLLSFIQSTNEDTEHSTSSSHHFEDSPFPSFNSTSDSAPFASNAFEEDVLTRKDLLEYLMNSDGSCVCKLCGEVLASRTHWYRHKYKVHTPAHISQTTNTSITPMENKLQDLHYCRECKQFFKSKKGYLGHLLARHSNEQDCSSSTHVQDTTHSSGAEKKTLSSGEENKLETTRSGDSFMVSILDEKDYNKQREMEEKMVKDIIAKVKRECEEQGEGEVMMMRKGYTKKMRK